MSDLTENIQDVTIGIRFNRSFRVKDVLGAFTDQLVYEKTSPLNGYFDEQNQDGKEMRLISQKGSYLRLNTDDIIFKHVCEKSFDKEMKFIEKYCDFITKVLKDYKVGNINRIGIIFTHHIKDDAKKFNEIIKGLTGNHISDTQDFSLSFSKKLATTDGSIKKGVKDYKNVIYLFKKLEKDKMGIGLDCQKYFMPPLEKAEDLDYKSFLGESENTLGKHFMKIYP